MDSNPFDFEGSYDDEDSNSAEAFFDVLSDTNGYDASEKLDVVFGYELK